MTNDPVGMNLNFIFPGVRLSELTGENGLRNNTEKNHQDNSQSSELRKQVYDIFDGDKPLNNDTASLNIGCSRFILKYIITDKTSYCVIFVILIMLFVVLPVVMCYSPFKKSSD